MRFPIHLVSTLTVIALALLPGAGAAAAAADDTATIAQFSMAVGINFSNQVRNAGLDGAAVLEGLRQGLAGETAAIDPTEWARLQAAFNGIRERQQAADEQGWKAANGLPASEDDTFYAEYVARRDVVTTATGLAYQVLQPGTGPKPAATDTVRVHYTGRETNGRVFDSSVQRGRPAEFPLNRVIQGWTEGLQLMPVGARYRFVIPAGLAYGPKVAGSDRPTGILIFDVELLGILGAAPTTPGRNPGR